MITKHDIYTIANEKYNAFIGTPSSAFFPLAAGLTYADPHYHVQRFNGDHYVFEYILDGTGYVEINGKTIRLNAGMLTSCFLTPITTIIPIQRIPGARYGSMGRGI